MCRPVIKRTGYRIYQNVLMASRLGEYACLLRSLADQGYTFLTVADLAAYAKGGSLPDLSCIIRMDVDSDTATAREMFEVAHLSVAKATYYFRLSTLDPSLMRRIAEHGSEVGFHYEELATVAKQRGLCDRRQVDEHIPAIRAQFKKNIAIYAECAGEWPRTIASHGDWINRKLRIPNQYAIDESLRRQFGIIAEAYDDWLNAPVKARFSDNDAPEWWKPGTPSGAISDRVSCLYFLVHPRQWRANVRENIRVDAVRATEGLRYSIRCGVSALQRRAFGASADRIA